MKVTLIPNHLDYVDQVYRYSQEENVRTALKLPKGTVEDTKVFLRSQIEAEENGIGLSRIVLNESGRVVGHTGLKDFDQENQYAFLGSWIAYDMWGKGYNEAAKHQILKIAFRDLGLEWVFLGANKRNIRSIRAQEKLPYIQMDLQERFPLQHQNLEASQQEPCILNGVCRGDFFRWLIEKD